MSGIHHTRLRNEDDDDGETTKRSESMRNHEEHHLATKESGEPPKVGVHTVTRAHQSVFSDSSATTGETSEKRSRCSTRSSLVHLMGSVIESVRKLSKSVTLLGGSCMMVSSIMGSGLFISPGLIMREVDDVVLIMVLWLFTGLVVLLGALCYCELGTTFSAAGGSYVYILQIYGPVAGFVTSWTLVLLVYPMGLSTITLTLGNYAMRPFADMFEPNPWYAKAVAAFCIVIISVTNCLSLKAANRLQSVFTFTQVSSVVFLVGLGIWQISIHHTKNFDNMFANVEDYNWESAKELGSGFFACIWAYNGWQLIANITEEMVDVEKNLLIVVLTSIPFVIVCYLMVNVAFLTAMTPKKAGESTAMAVDFVRMLFGEKASWLVPVLVVISCYGSANASVFSCPRVSLAAGRENHMPSILSLIHKERQTPIPAIIITALLALAYLAPDSSNLSVLINISGIASWILFTLTLLGIIVLRFTKPNMTRPFKVWLILPIFVTCVAAFLIVIPVMRRPVLSAGALGFIVLGIPVYYLTVRLKDHHPAWLKRICRSSTNFIKAKLHLAQCVN